MSNKRVLSVGQCGYDHSAISRALRSAFGAEVVSADSADEALDQLRQEVFALVLVNRVLDADGSSGLEVVRRIKADEAVSRLPVMLVSNYEDAQEEAVQNGAVKGFGKSQVSSEKTTSLLRPFLE